MTHAYISLEHETDFSKNYFIVSWTLNNVCNYSCSYCSPGLYNGSIKGPELAQILSFIDKVFEAKPDQKVYFEFSGGEITFHKDFVSIFEHIKRRGGECGIISNGSKPLAWWKEHVHLLDHVCLSFHVERGHKEKFYELASFLSNKLTLHVNLMILPEKFKELYSFGRKLAAEIDGIGISLQPLLNNFSGPMYPYSQEELEIIRSADLPWRENLKTTNLKSNKVYRGGMVEISASGQRKSVDPSLLIAKAENRWLGWDCLIGVENIVVELDGFVYRGYCRVGGSLGSFLDPKFKFPSEPVTCIKKNCTCIFDIMATKTSVNLLK